MKPVRHIRLCATAAVVAFATIGSAHAAGCMKGAAVGGVAGHYAGHHAVAGAVGGCIVGHHMAKKHEKEEAAQRKAAAHDAQASQ